MKAIEVVYKKYNISLTNVTNFYCYFKGFYPENVLKPTTVGLSTTNWQK